LLDSIAIRTTGLAAKLTPAWGALSEWTLNRVDGLIEVTDERLARHRVLPSRSTVIFNSPVYREVAVRKDLPSPFVFVSGSAVGGISGLETLLAAVNQLPLIEIVFAGRVDDPWIRDTFLASPKVHYLGLVSPEQSLEIAAASLGMFAHYRPVNMNYLFAAPNKLFDAMMLGVPLFINAECQASAFATRYGFGLVTPYGDVPALRGMLERALRSEPELMQACERARVTFRSEFDWSLMGERYRHFFNSLVLPH
jgi:glycosyltransferase involved in cell wall biosynthesis